MNRVQIDVPCRFERNNGRTTTWIVMPGELLHNIAPHLAHICTFAVCVTPFGDILDSYIVVSLETGLRVRGSHPTMDAAISAARKVLKGITPEYAELRTNKERPEGE